MFANPLWSVLLICAPVALYWFVIRPRLKARFTDLYSNVDTRLGRIWARIWAFRTPIMLMLGPIFAALPDLIVLIPGMDLSFLPQPWAAWTNGAAVFATAYMKARETTRATLPPPAAA